MMTTRKQQTIAAAAFAQLKEQTQLLARLCTLPLAQTPNISSQITTLLSSKHAVWELSIRSKAYQANQTSPDRRWRKCDGNSI